MSVQDRLSALKASFKKPAATGNSSYYPFYRMQYDEKATIRFLPDANPTNPLGFLFEKVEHSVKGADGKDVKVPCLSMYGEDCPVCAKAAEFFKVEGKESPRGKALYKKRQHIAQVLVVKDPLPYKEGEVPATGQVRLLGITYTLYQKIQSAIADDELRVSPDDYNRGTDFTIKKTKKGDYANYENSKFERDERALTETELATIEGKLIDLSSVRPAKPTLDECANFIEGFLSGNIVSTSSQPANGASYQQQAANPNEYLSNQAAPVNQTPVAAPQAASSPGDDEAARVLAEILARR